ESWTTASSGEHKVELPIDYTIRALMMRPYATGGIWNTIWTHFKLDCDMGKFIAFDLDQHEFRDLMMQQFGPYLVRYFMVATNNEQKEAWLGEVFDCQGSHQTTPPDITSLYSSGWPVFFTYIADHAGGAATDALVQASASGYYPHTNLLWPFGRWQDPETWFSPRTLGYGSVDLKITEATASAAAQVAVQQVRPLP
ncbi:MAG: hypothetical protein KKF27_20215, partial [Gammaproteobacteria bacterium]|nr:hypothetical protein [Gammaproteobacteria bacterium]